MFKELFKFMNEFLMDVVIGLVLIFFMLMVAYVYLPFSVEYLVVTGAIMIGMFLFGLFLSRKAR